MANYKGIGYLRKKLATKKVRVDVRYKYYEMKNTAQDYVMTLPEKYKWLNCVFGWCTKSVDSLADRLDFYGFENDNFDFEEIFNMNNPGVFFNSAILSALISSCCFVYISADKDGYPRLQVIDGANATGIIDPITGLLDEGYAVLERDDNDKPIVEAYFIKGKTQIIRKGQPQSQIINHPNVPYPLLVPIIYRPDAKRYFGRSRISRAQMGIVDSLIRTMKRLEVSSEYYSFPQKYILGMSEDAEAFEKWKASISSMLVISKDDDDQVPSVGQFSQMSMAPFVDVVKMNASLFAGETGLTVDDLGFVSDNPSSADAIKSSHENLRLYARKAQKTFGECFLNVGYLAACLRDNMSYERSQIYLTKPIWEPIFEPDATMLSVIGDGAIKLNQAVPGYFGKDNLRKLTGIEPSENETVTQFEEIEE